MGTMTGNRLAARAHGRLEAPLLHGFHGFFFESEARALHDLNFVARPSGVMTACSTTVP